jgi:hypothetical protein
MAVESASPILRDFFQRPASAGPDPIIMNPSLCSPTCRIGSTLPPPLHDGVGTKPLGLAGRLCPRPAAGNEILDPDRFTAIAAGNITRTVGERPHSRIRMLLCALVGGRTYWLTAQNQ